MKFLGLIYLMSCLVSLSQSISWGTGFSGDSQTHVSYFSNGMPDVGDGSTGTLNWTLGYFNAGFSPTPQNYDQWVANYNEVDTALYIDDTFGWRVPGDFTSPDPESLFGIQIWTFVYNDLNAIGTSAGEVLLYSDGQTFPTSGVIDADIQSDIKSTPEDNAAFELIWGRVDRLRFEDGGVLTQEASVFTGIGQNLLEGDFEGQTGTWAIPEPSSVICLLLSGVCLLTRRQR